MEINRIQEQLDLQKYIKFKEIENIQYIAGMDCAYWNTNYKHYGCVAYQIFNYKTGEVVEQNIFKMETSEMYEKGFLYYREEKLLNYAFLKMKIKPDIIVLDGNGLLHPRFMGEATQFGILNNIPTIGIAKKLFKFEGLEEHNNKFYFKNKLVGCAIKLSDNSKIPSIISSGYLVPLDQAVKIVKYMQQFSINKSKYSYLTKGSDHLVREFERNFIEIYGGIKD